MNDTTPMDNNIFVKHKTARLAISAIILFITYIGVTTIDIHSREFWFFTQVLAITISCLSLWLYWYIFRDQHYTHKVTIWHQLLHWCSTMIAIYTLTLLVSSGLVSANQAGILTLTILSFSLFLAGIYTDTIFILLGISLGLLNSTIATPPSHLLLYETIILFGSALLIFFIAQYQQYIMQKKTKEKQ